MIFLKTVWQQKMKFFTAYYCRSLQHRDAFVLTFLVFFKLNLNFFLFDSFEKKETLVN